MSKNRVCLASSAIRISIAMSVGDSTCMHEEKFLVNNQEHIGKSRGKGKTRKQWEKIQ